MFEFITDEKLREQAIEAHKKDILGLKEKNGELIAAQKELKQSVALLTDKLGEFDGLDPAETKKILKEMREDRLNKMLGDNKIDEVIAERVKDVENKYKQQLETAQNNFNELKSNFDKLTGDNNRLELSGIIGDLGAQSGINPKAMQTLIQMAGAVFRRDENNNFVPYDQNGQVISNKEGSGPLAAKDWVEGLRETHDFMFSKQQGGGGQQDGAGGGAVDVSKMTEAEITEALENDPSFADNLQARP